MKKSFLITGAASGIGASLANLVTARGDHAICLDRQMSSGLSCDLSDGGIIEATAKLVDGPIHGIAHVAGLPGTKETSQIIAVNIAAPMALTRLLKTKLAPGSSIVAVSSITALRCQLDQSKLDQFLDAGVDQISNEAAKMDGKAAYEFSKALLNRWAIRVAAEYASDGIRVNTVSPGPVQTPILNDFKTSIGADRIAAAEQLVGRHAEAEEIAEAAYFLLSRRASWVNGTDLKVDGGYHAMRSLGMEAMSCA